MPKTPTEQGVDKAIQGKDLAGRPAKTDTLEFAVSQLMKEPEPEEIQETATPEEEPEETEEEVEEIHLEEEEVEETPSEESEDTLEEEVTEEEEEETLDYYRVKLDGEELEVTLDELQNGYQRQKDYTKKTQDLAEQRKDYESKQTELEKLQQDFMNQAVLANEVLNRDLKKFEKVDWETLRADNPTEYVAKQLEMQDTKQRQADLQAQAQSVYEHNQKVAEAERSKYLEAERKKALTLFPEWKDQQKAQANQIKIVEYARSQGFQDQELANVVSARDLLIIDKARQFDEMQSQARTIASKKATPAVRKVVKSKGSAPKGTTKARNVKARQTQLRKSGSVKDAAALMYEMRSGNKAIKRRQ